jgi:hypothetical protein
LLFTVLVIVLGMFGAVVGFLDPANVGVEGVVRDYGDWRDLLWWAVRHILDPAFFYAQYGGTPYLVLVSLGVSIGSLVVFSALLGLIISSLEERLEILRCGDSNVLERGYVLILGWNSRVPEVISLLGERSQRQTVVVLAPQEPVELREALRLAGVDRRKVRVILRSGMADSMAELDRVAWASAAAVMVVPNETQEILAADAAVVRTLLLLRQAAEARRTSQGRRSDRTPGLRRCGAPGRPGHPGDHQRRGGGAEDFPVRHAASHDHPLRRDPVAPGAESPGGTRPRVGRGALRRSGGGLPMRHPPGGQSPGH